MRELQIVQAWINKDLFQHIEKLLRSRFRSFWFDFCPRTGNHPLAFETDAVERNTCEYEQIH